MRVEPTTRWTLLGRCWAYFETPLGPSGVPLGPSWGPLESSWGVLGASLAPLGTFATSCPILGSSWDPLDLPWEPLGSLLGASCEPLGGLLGSSGGLKSSPKSPPGTILASVDLATSLRHRFLTSLGAQNLAKASQNLSQDFPKWSENR